MNVSCPCKRKKCERHGDCEACRAHHAESKRKRPVACDNEFTDKLHRFTQSHAYLDLCEEVYGYRGCLINMMDKEQIEYVLNQIPIHPEDEILELGCGTGDILRLLTDKYRCKSTGIDIVPCAEWQNTNSLKYFCGDMDKLSDFKLKPTITLAVDSLYFIKNMEKLLRSLSQIPGNRLYLFYSYYQMDAINTCETSADRTPLAEALRKAGLAYRTASYSENERLMYLRMEQALLARKDEFQREGNEDLLEQKLKETRQGIDLFQRKCACRYLYIVE